MQATEQIHEIAMPHKLSAYLRRGMNKYRQIKCKTSDGADGRCALGVILSEQGWDGKSECWTWGMNNARILHQIIDYNDKWGFSYFDIVMCLEVKGY
jgi:hypothetical protein